MDTMMDGLSLDFVVEQLRGKVCDLCKGKEGEVCKDCNLDYDVDSNPEILDDFVCVAKKAADAAGSVVKQAFMNVKSVTTFKKYDNDGSTVEQTTSADLDAEYAMASLILQNFPNHLVFGEELGWLPRERHDADYVWVLDPIDGTTSFKHGIPMFGTLIALLYKSKPILGIIDQPILRRRWVGVQGRITTMDDADVRTRPCEQLSRATLYTYSPDHFSNEEKEAFNRVTQKAPEPGFGAECFHYGLLASGFIDVIVQSFLGPYDFLAFIPIIEGAGGIITDWAGQKLKWEASPTFVGPTYYRIIVSGDERVHKDALEYLKECQLDI